MAVWSLQECRYMFRNAKTANCSLLIRQFTGSRCVDNHKKSLRLDASVMHKKVKCQRKHSKH